MERIVKGLLHIARRGPFLPLHVRRTSCGRWRLFAIQWDLEFHRDGEGFIFWVSSEIPGELAPENTAGWHRSWGLKRPLRYHLER